MGPMVGEEFAGYRLIGVLGRGGMSVVFQAENARIGSTVALKILAPELSSDDIFRARFLQESRIAASLNHPNVIPIYDMGPHGDLLYIAMRYVPGSDLREILRRDRTLTPAQGLLMIHQAARALDHAHRAGLVHRDVKPANMLVQRGVDDDPDHVYLADFGISKHALSRTGLTPTGQFMGTIDYIAPEQIQGHVVDGRADIYSLGCVLYEALTGRVPFIKEADAAVIWAHVEEMPTAPSRLRPELGTAVDDVMARVLAKNPADRYASGREFVEAARAALATKDEPPETVLSGPAEQWSAPTRPASAPQASQPSREAESVGATAAAPTEAASGPGPLQTGGDDSGGARYSPPPPSGGGVFPAGAGGRSPSPRREGRSGWLLPALIGVLVLLAIGGIWYGLHERDSSGTPATAGGPSSGATSSGHPSASPGSGSKNPIMDILTNTNTSTEAKGYIPTDTCHALSSSKVSCAPQVNGANSATFQTFQTLPELYAAYLDRVEQISGHRPTMDQMAVGDCNATMSEGEVTWNHMYQHPRNFTISQVASGRYQSDVAGGRLFCLLENGREHIIWTSNDIKLLGDVTGFGSHSETFQWWKLMHHNMGPMADMSMDKPSSTASMSPGM
jgi:serine/threonine protein kinase